MADPSENSINLSSQLQYNQTSLISGLVMMALTVASRLNFCRCCILSFSTRWMDSRHWSIQPQVAIIGSQKTRHTNKDISHFLIDILKLSSLLNPNPNTSFANSRCDFSQNALLVETFISLFSSPCYPSNLLPTKLIFFSQSNTMLQYSGMLLGSTYERKTSFYCLTFILPKSTSVSWLFSLSSRPIVVLSEATLGLILGSSRSNLFWVRIWRWKESTPVSSRYCKPYNLSFQYLSSMSSTFSLDYTNSSVLLLLF